MPKSVKSGVALWDTKFPKNRLQAVLHYRFTLAQLCAFVVRKQESREVWLLLILKIVPQRRFQSSWHGKCRHRIPVFGCRISRVLSYRSSSSGNRLANGLFDKAAQCEPVLRIESVKGDAHSYSGMDVYHRPFRLESISPRWIVTRTLDPGSRSVPKRTVL